MAVIIPSAYRMDLYKPHSHCAIQSATRLDFSRGKKVQRKHVYQHATKIGRGISFPVLVGQLWKAYTAEE